MEDFWRMIWEKRIPTIVMLTKVYEGKVSRTCYYQYWLNNNFNFMFVQKKCEKYWPENCSEPFTPRAESMFTVEMNSSVPFAEYTIRKMKIAKVRSYVHQGVFFTHLGYRNPIPSDKLSCIFRNYFS